MKKYIEGIFTLNPRGFGFVEPEDKTLFPSDIFIAARNAKTAVEGDRVEVVIDTSRPFPKGPEGCITRILKRARTIFAGTVRKKINDTYLVYVPLLGPSRPFLLSSKIKLEAGDRVLIKVKMWGKKITCHLMKIIGNINDPSADIPCALEEFQIHSSFPKKVSNEAVSFGTKISKQALQKREDLTHLTCITIDPKSARDFDDAVSLVEDKAGNYLLGVHITDVAHYVRSFSSLDNEAYLRGNSVYFPGRCVPMLPEVLSNNLCSLKPNVIRLCISVLMTFDKEGELLDYKIIRSFIKSRRRFSYEEALSHLTTEDSSYFHLLNKMVDLCHLLKKKRFERGSIDFSFNDKVVVVDEKGNPLKLKTIKYDITHQLIEEFMLKANETVATHLTKERNMLIYRIHENPSFEDFEDFYDVVRALGFSLPSHPDHRDIQRLFSQAKDTPFQQFLSINFIRSMKLAYYSSANIGHYGLALDHYCHFTSPIRRYTDLVVQRLLFNEEPEGVDLDRIAVTCSHRERISLQAENAVTLLKKFRLLSKYLKEEPDRNYDAVIVRIKRRYLIFEILDFAIEGAIPIPSLTDDYFIFEPHLFRLRGERSGKFYSVLDKIKVKLKKVDLILLNTEWEIEK